MVTVTMVSRSTTVRSRHRRQQPPRCCANCGAATVRLYQDHIINLAADPNADTVANMQWLCKPCHDAKTERERIAGLHAYHAKRYRAAEAHPGAL